MHMLNAKILWLLFKEEFRLQASFFNRSYFLTSSLVMMLFTFIIGLSYPMLRRAVAVEDILLVAHWIILFYGFGVGGFALFGDRILERRFGSISLILGSGYTLPIRFRRLFMLFYLKDTLYYLIFTILPMMLGLVLASIFVPISPSSLVVLSISLTLSFLLGISFSVLLFTIIGRIGGKIVLVLAAVSGILGAYLGAIGTIDTNVSEIAAGLPSLVYYQSQRLDIALIVLITVMLFALVSSFFIKEFPQPSQRTSIESYRKIVSKVSGPIKGYGPLLAKDMIDLIRSGLIFAILFTFIMPLLFLYAVTWFIESVMLINISLGFSLLFYAAMVGFFCTLLYSWLSNIDISECYNSLPLSMAHAIRTKLILYFIITSIVAVPYLIGVGYLKKEIHLLWISLIIMLTVSAYVGSVLAYLTGLFTNSYLLDAKILFLFALAVVPVMVAETILSFYYPLNPEFAAIIIVCLGFLLVAGSIILLGKLETKWKDKMFRIA